MGVGNGLGLPLGWLAEGTGLGLPLGWLCDGTVLGLPLWSSVPSLSVDEADGLASRLVQYESTESVPPAVVTRYVKAGLLSALPCSCGRDSQAWHRPRNDGDGLAAGCELLGSALGEADGDAESVDVLVASLWLAATAATAVSEAWLECGSGLGR